MKRLTIASVLVFVLLAGNARGNETVMEFLSPGDVTVEDAFWSAKFETWRTKTIGDVFDKFEGRPRHDGGRSDWFANFDRVAAGRFGDGSHVGPPFANGLVYETISGVSDYLLRKPDPALAARLDGYIARIAAAQAKGGDGYINTWTQLRRPQSRWGVNGGCLLNQHDIYNLGMLIEAGLHHHRATGKTTLLAVALRAANHLCDTIGPAPKQNHVPTHSGPEEPLILLARLCRAQPGVIAQTGVPGRPADYLALVEFWMQARGDHCGLPDWSLGLGGSMRWIGEHSAEVYDPKDPHRRPSWGDYSMDRIPLAEYPSIEGHAVRATLLATGLATLAGETGDRTWTLTAARLWDSMAGRKMYVTGGVGSVPACEAFGPDYHLPSASYLETCAAIGGAFFSGRLAELTGDGKYMDVFERVVYNALLTAVGLDGVTYTYQNPLESSRHNRWAWHGCPCCPPMFLKITGALPGYIYAHRADGVWVNLYIASRAEIPLAGGARAALKLETAYPRAGTVKVTVEKPGTFTLHLRVPGWARGCENPFDLYRSEGLAAPRLRVNGEETACRPVRGYVAVRRAWRTGDRVELALDAGPRLVRPHAAIRDLAGKASLAAGPLVYAFERCDNAGYATLVTPAAETLRRVACTDLAGCEALVSDEGVKAIPYHAIANRGSNTAFRVWAPLPAELQTPQVTVSHCFRGDTPEALLDGRVSKTSQGEDVPHFSFFPKRGTSEWVQLAWQGARKVKAVEVFWLDDSKLKRDCPLPAACHFEWRPSAESLWRRVAADGEIAGDRFCTYAFPEMVRAQAIRLVVQSRPGWSSGVLELRVR